MSSSEQQDRILPITKITAGIVVPFLVLAFLILYFYPERSGEWFAWTINPPITAMFMGAGYIGGAWLFINAIFGKEWHRIAPGFFPITAFTTVMLLTTLIHWDRFELTHFPFILWLVLYIITPFLVPTLWVLNRSANRGIPDNPDHTVPQIARTGLLLIGIIILFFSLRSLLNPEWLISLWVWKLSPLTARIMSGWFALLGVGGVVISSDPRWSAWKVGLQSIGLWHLLVLIAAFIRKDDFSQGLWNWYTLSVFAVLSGMLALYIKMEWLHSDESNTSADIR